MSFYIKIITTVKKIRRKKSHDKKLALKHGFMWNLFNAFFFVLIKQMNAKANNRKHLKIHVQ